MGPNPNSCHFDRRDGAFCRPEVEKSLINFDIQDKSQFPRNPLRLIITFGSSAQLFVQRLFQVHRWQTRLLQTLIQVRNLAFA